MYWNPFYHQLPVRSPIPAAALISALTMRRAASASKELSELLRHEYHSEETILTGSGTQALQLAIRAAALRSGEPSPRLALPAFTCFDVGTAGVWSGLPLLFYDIDPDTLAPNLESLERALREGAGVIVISPLYGVPVPWEAIHSLAVRYGAALIEDAAQGHGARWRGRRLGTLGEISILSFGRGKGWTGGLGGVVLFRGAAAARNRAAVIDDLGASGDSGLISTAAQWALGRPSLYGIPLSLPWLGLGETHYREPGEPKSMPPAAAGLALASFVASEREAEGRRRRARDLAQRLTAHRGGCQVPGLEMAEADPGFLRLPVRVPDARSVVSSLRRWGVAPSYPIPLPELAPVQSRMVGAPGRWPGAVALARELVTLPTHGRVGERDLERIIHGLPR